MNTIIYDDNLNPMFSVPSDWPVMNGCTRNIGHWHFYVPVSEPAPIRDEVLEESFDLNVVAVRYVYFPEHSKTIWVVLVDGAAALVEHPDVASWPRARRAAQPTAAGP